MEEDRRASAGREAAARRPADGEAASVAEDRRGGSQAARIVDRQPGRRRYCIRRRAGETPAAPTAGAAGAGAAAGIAVIGAGGADVASQQAQQVQAQQVQAQQVQAQCVWTRRLGLPQALPTTPRLVRCAPWCVRCGGDESGDGGGNGGDGRL